MFMARKPRQWLVVIEEICLLNNIPAHRELKFDLFSEIFYVVEIILHEVLATEICFCQ